MELRDPQEEIEVEQSYITKTILRIYTHPNNYVEYDEYGLIMSLPEIEIRAPKKSDD